MIDPEKLLKMISDHKVGAADLVQCSGAQFRVPAHEGWTRYDASAGSLVDAENGVVVPTRVEDIVAFRFGEAGKEHAIAKRAEPTRREREQAPKGEREPARK